MSTLGEGEPRKLGEGEPRKPNQEWRAGTNRETTRDMPRVRTPFDKFGAFVYVGARFGAHETARNFLQRPPGEPRT